MEFSTHPSNILTIAGVSKDTETPFGLVATDQCTEHEQSFKKCYCKTKCQSNKFKML